MRTQRTRHSRERGSAMVEFALSATMLIVLFTGIFEWGYTFYVYNNVATNIRAGARYAAQKAFVPATNSTSTNPNMCPSFERDVRNMVVYGSPNPASGATPVAPGMTINNVQVTPIYDSGGVPVTIRVRISPTNSYSIGAVVAHTQLSSKPSVTFPYTGIYSPAGGCN